MWFDRQYGNLATAITQGWQWFAMSLADGSEVMLFNFRENEQSGSKRTIEPNYGSITAGMCVLIIIISFGL